MVEITHGGTWFRWSSMDPRDRFLFVVSTLAILPTGLVGGIALGRWTYWLGYRIGAGEHGPDPLGPVLDSDLFRFGALAAFLFLLVSLIAWWRFSLRQDEMFNRIQNDALGRGGAWTLVLAAGWWVLSLGGWTGALPLGVLVHVGLALILVFWIRAVRRCT